MKYFVLLVITCLLFQSCAEPEAAQTKHYFDLKGLIDAQIKQLDAHKKRVQKTITVDGQAETKQLEELDWAKELELFQQADLNKAAYKQSYVVVENDSSILYTLKPTEKVAIKKLSIFKNQGQVIRIEAQLEEKNYLYHSQKNLEAHFSKGVIDSYRIEGFQQLVLGNKKAYSIVGRIQHD